MKKRFFVFAVICASAISFNLSAQPTDPAPEMTEAQKYVARLAALETQSVIKDTQKKYDIILDDPWDWYNNVGSYKNEIYFNVFHNMSETNGGQILNRYCGYVLTNSSSDPELLARVGVKLSTDKTSMSEECGKLPGSSFDVVPVTTIEVPTSGLYTMNLGAGCGGGSFEVNVSRTDDYQAYYELYSTDKEYKLVFYAGNKTFPSWYPNNIIPRYQEYLRSSYIKKLDTNGYLESYGMDFDHRGNVYCASFQAINPTFGAMAVGTVVFHIKGEAAAAKCSGVADKDLIKIELPDPGEDEKEYKKALTFKDMTFNITFKGEEAQYSIP